MKNGGRIYPVSRLEGNVMSENQAVPANAMKQCPFCAEDIRAEAKKCKHCGETLDVTLRIAEEARRAAAGGMTVVSNNNNNVVPAVPVFPQIVYMTPPKNRLTAVLLCIFFGCLGLHRFYTGHSGRGIIYLLTFGLLGLGVLWDLIALVFHVEGMYANPSVNWM